MLNKFFHWLCVLGILLPLPITASAAPITLDYDGTIIRLRDPKGLLAA